MNGYNKVILKGTAGGDAEVKTLEGGSTVANMSIAINDSYTDKESGERKTKVEWVRIEAWKGLATWLGQYGKKGTDFLIEGRIKTDNWEKDGETRYSTKVVAEKIIFTQPMKANNTGALPIAHFRPCRSGLGCFGVPGYGLFNQTSTVSDVLRDFLSCNSD